LVTSAPDFRCQSFSNKHRELHIFNAVAEVGIAKALPLDAAVADEAGPKVVPGSALFSKPFLFGGRVGWTNSAGEDLL
jgi:hypothetical protein